MTVKSVVFLQMHTRLVVLAAFCFLLSCSSQKPDPETAFFPVKSYLLSQVSHVDTSIYNIRKITTTAVGTDTVVVSREAFRALAADFLAIPDLTADKWSDDYTETKLFDETLNKAVLTYLPKESDAEIRREEVIIEPNAAEGDHVQTFFIERVYEEGGKTFEKKMLWQVNHWFQVVTIVKAKDQPEEIQKLKVVWTDGPSAE